MRDAETGKRGGREEEGGGGLGKCRSLQKNVFSNNFSRVIPGQEAYA